MKVSIFVGAGTRALIKRRSGAELERGGGGGGSRVITPEQSSDFSPAQLVIHHGAEARGKKGD